MITAADDYPLLDLLWTFFYFFALMVYFWLLITVFGDLFRRHDVSGWAKAGWTVFVLVLPLIGALTYLITQGRAMADRDVRRVQEATAADRRLHPVGGGPGLPRRRRDRPRQGAARRGRDQPGGVRAAEAARPRLMPDAAAP